MRVLNTIKDGDKLVGYRVSYSDDPALAINMDVCCDAMLTYTIVTELINSGYKYYEYDHKSITDASGKPISELPAISFAERDNDTWNGSVAKANTDKMSDYDMSKYYSYKSVSTIEFKKESSYEINTREELIRYLVGMNKGLGIDIWSLDNRPINAITNPSALFTLDEVINDKSVTQYLNLINKRHRFRDYRSYSNLVKWLIEKGVLQTENPTIAEFMNAYLAWGPDGINASCTSVETKLNVDGQFSYVSEPLYDMRSDDPASAKHYMEANRETVYAVLNGNLVASDLHTKYDFTPIATCTDELRAPLIVSTDEALLQLKRRDFNGYRYTYVPKVRKSIVTDRVYMELLAENGHTYIYKMDVNNISVQLKQIRTNESVYRTTQNFTVATVVPGSYLSLGDVTSNIDYYMWNATYLRMVKLWGEKTTPVPETSSAAMLFKEGINPLGVIGYMARWIKDNKHSNIAAETYSFETGNAGAEKDPTYILQSLFNPIPADVLTAYGIEGSSLEEGISSFIKMVDVEDLKMRRELMRADFDNPDRINRGDPGWDPTYTVALTDSAKADNDLAILSAIKQDQELRNDPMSDLWDAIDYVTCLNIAFDTLDKTIQVGDLAKGYFADREINLTTVVRTLVTVLMNEFKATGDYTTDISAINNILDGCEDNHIFDINSLIRERREGFVGYLIDLAKYRNMRAGDNCIYWCYVNRVFNEISMKPIEERRPYAMELLTLNINDDEHRHIREAVTECIYNAINESSISDDPFTLDPTHVGYEWSIKKCALEMAPWFASKTAFYIMARLNKLELNENGDYVTRLNIFEIDNEDYYVDIVIPSYVLELFRNHDIEYSKKFITLYDYCRHEYVSAFNISSYCCINADIDPWHVYPKKGYKIGTYDLLANYYTPETLNSAINDAGYYDANAGTGIVVAPMTEADYLKWLPWYNTQEDWAEWDRLKREVSATTEVSDLDWMIYDWDTAEPVFAYIKRWMLEKKKAHAEGKMLVSIPLKQDIVFTDIAHYFCEETPETVPMISANAADDRIVNTRCDTRVLTYDMNVDNTALLTNTVFMANKLSLDDILCYPDVFLRTVSSEWLPTTKVAVYSNYILVGQNKYNIYQCNSQFFNDLANQGVIIKLAEDRYYIKAVNGEFVIGV